MKKPASFAIVATYLVGLFSFISPNLFAETAVAPRPVKPPAVSVPKVKTPEVPKVPTVDPMKPTVPKVGPGAQAPSSGALSSPDPRPAKRLGSHAGEAATSGSAGQRELAPKKLSHDQVKERIKYDPLLEQVKDSPEALDGLSVREGLLDTALNGQKALTHISSGKFEKALMEKLVGKDFSKIKEQDLKDLQSLTCGPMCGGHEKMALSCRRITRFLDAVKSTPGILATSGALGTLFAAFVNYTDKPEKKNGSEVISVAGDGVFAEVKDLNKEVSQEKLVPVPAKTEVGS